MNLKHYKDSQPRVSVIVFGYNQEKFLSNAIESCFRQDYRNLEIILSDDHSSDGSFQLMRSLAESYKGNHTVKVRRNPKNLGTFNHLLEVAQIASGELVVYAAGDDISDPSRVSELVKFWLVTDADCICSDVAILCDSGSQCSSIVTMPSSSQSGLFVKLFENGKFFNVAGASAAYRRSTLLEFPQSEERLLLEDFLLALLLQFQNKKIAYLEKKLVEYRWHDNNVSNRSQTLIGDNKSDMLKKLAHNEQYYLALCYFDHFAQSDSPDCQERRISLSYLSFLKDLYFFLAFWPKISPLQRISCIFHLRKFLTPLPQLSKIFGLNVYVLLKTLFRSKVLQKLNSKYASL